MRKIISLAALAALVFGAFSCTPKEEPIYDVTVQLVADGQPFAVEGVSVSLTDGVAVYEGITDANGIAAFKVIAGAYSATTSFSNNMSLYNGNSNAITVGPEALAFNLNLAKSKGSQIIIKELYIGGCFDEETESKYAKDPYMILYNNSQFEADASNVVFSVCTPAQAVSANPYANPDGTFKFESEGWLPASAAMWWFQSPVKMAPYSQIVVVFFGAIDHTAGEGGFKNSIDLSSHDYYWMSNEKIAAFTDPKYVASDGFPESHKLTGAKISGRNSWSVDMTQPAIYIANMPTAEASALATNSTDFDKTIMMFDAAKMPIDNVLDCIEVWAAGSEEKSNVRFPASVNTGHVSATTYLGHSLYRNVNQAATEALAENEGKLVYNYAGAVDEEAEISAIDAEASIANGAHIVYMDTNNSSLDFHERKAASLKK